MSPQNSCISRSFAPTATNLILAQHQAQLQGQTSLDCNAAVARMRRGMQRIRTAQAQERRSCSFLFLH